MTTLQLSRRAIETLVVTLVAAAVSGLAFVAYRYPTGYRKLAVAIAMPTFLFSLYDVTFKLGYAHSQLAALTERLKEQPSAPLSASEHLVTGIDQRVSSIARVVVVCALVLGYLALLWFLPSILGSTEGAGAAGGA